MYSTNPTSVYSPLASLSSDLVSSGSRDPPAISRAGGLTRLKDLYVFSHSRPDLDTPQETAKHMIVSAMEGLAESEECKRAPDHWDNGWNVLVLLTRHPR